MSMCRLTLCPFVAIVAALFLLAASQSLSSACLEGNCNQDCKTKEAYCFAGARGYYYDYDFADNQCSTMTQGGAPCFPNSCYRYIRDNTTCYPDCPSDAQDFGGVGDIDKYAGYITSMMGATINTSCYDD